MAHGAGASDATECLSFKLVEKEEQGQEDTECPRDKARPLISRPGRVVGGNGRIVGGEVVEGRGIIITTRWEGQTVTPLPSHGDNQEGGGKT